MPSRLEKHGADDAVGEAAARHASAGGNGADLNKLLSRIRQLAVAGDTDRDSKADRELLALRHRAGVALQEGPAAGADYPEPDFEGLKDGAGVPEVDRADLSPQLLRAAILRHGCLLVRGMIEADDAGPLRDGIDRALAARREGGAPDPDPDGYFEEFVPDPRYEMEGLRKAAKNPEAMWVVDSPRVAAELFDVFERSGLVRLASGYLGEHPAFSVQKSTLRRVTPKPVTLSLWHQDGAFLGEVRALNVWLSLSRCGDLAPGLDLASTRIDHILPTGTEGAPFKWSISKAVAEEAAGEAGISRPVFEPGDALLFDELFVHSTAFSREMKSVRYAVECWFFSPSAFPAGTPPLAI